MKLHSYIIERYTRARTIGPFTNCARATVLKPSRRRLVEFMARKESREHPRSLVILRRQHDRHIAACLVNGRPVDPRSIIIELRAASEDIFTLDQHSRAESRSRRSASA